MDDFGWECGYFRRENGSPGDGGPLGEREQAHYTKIQRWNAKAVCAQVKAGDVVILHDPQTAGLASALHRLGATVIWRCHIGIDQQNAISDQTWGFLQPHLKRAHAFIFSRQSYVPSWIHENSSISVCIIPPAIDAFAVKNTAMSPATVRAILAKIGLINASGERATPSFTCLDGTMSQVQRQADIVRAGAAPGPDVPLVVQISRWDRLKDMLGVMRGLVDHLKGAKDAHLVLAGPNVQGVSDDPEGLEVLNECIAAWHKLPKAKQNRVHLVCLPMEDTEENAAMVNALQRHAAIIVQKSLQEGFGLTITEAMWKGRPVVASAVGGIQDQIVSGTHGMLLDDPSDLKAFGKVLRRLLTDQEFAGQLGRNAKQRTIAHFLAPNHLMNHAALILRLERLEAGDMPYAAV